MRTIFFSICLLMVFMACKKASNVFEGASSALGEEQAAQQKKELEKIQQALQSKVDQLKGKEVVAVPPKDIVVDKQIDIVDKLKDLGGALVPPVVGALVPPGALVSPEAGIAGNELQLADVTMPKPSAVTYHDEELKLSEIIPGLTQIKLGTEPFEKSFAYDSWGNPTTTKESSPLNFITCLVNESFNGKFDNTVHDVNVDVVSSRCFQEQENSHSPTFKTIIYNTLKQVIETPPKMVFAFKIKGERTPKGPGIITVQIKDTSLLSQFIAAMSSLPTLSDSERDFWEKIAQDIKGGSLSLQFIIWAPATPLKPLGQFEFTINSEVGSAYFATWNEEPAPGTTGSISRIILSAQEKGSSLKYNILNTANYTYPDADKNYSILTSNLTLFAENEGKKATSSIVFNSDRFKMTDSTTKSECHLAEEIPHYYSYSLKKNGQIIQDPISTADFSDHLIYSFTDDFHMVNSFYTAFSQKTSAIIDNIGYNLKESKAFIKVSEIPTSEFFKSQNYLYSFALGQKWYLLQSMTNDSISYLESSGLVNSSLLLISEPMIPMIPMIPWDGFFSFKYSGFLSFSEAFSGKKVIRNFQIMNRKQKDPIKLICSTCNDQTQYTWNYSDGTLKSDVGAEGNYKKYFEINNNQALDPTFYLYGNISDLPEVPSLLQEHLPAGQIPIFMSTADNSIYVSKTPLTLTYTYKSSDDVNRYNTAYAGKTWTMKFFMNNLPLEDLPLSLKEGTEVKDQDGTVYQLSPNVGFLFPSTFERFPEIPAAACTDITAPEQKFKAPDILKIPDL